MGFIGKAFALFAGFIAAIAQLAVDHFTDFHREKEAAHFYMNMAEGSNDIDLQMVTHDGQVVRGKILETDIPQFVEAVVTLGLQLAPPKKDKDENSDINMQYT